MQFKGEIELTSFFVVFFRQSHTFNIFASYRCKDFISFKRSRIFPSRFQWIRMNCRYFIVYVHILATVIMSKNFVIKFMFYACHWSNRVKKKRVFWCGLPQMPSNKKNAGKHSDKFPFVTIAFYHIIQSFLLRVVFGWFVGRVSRHLHQTKYFSIEMVTKQWITPQNCTFTKADKKIRSQCSNSPFRFSFHNCFGKSHQLAKTQLSFCS